VAALRSPFVPVHAVAVIAARTGAAFGCVAAPDLFRPRRHELREFKFNLRPHHAAGVGLLIFTAFAVAAATHT